MPYLPFIAILNGEVVPASQAMVPVDDAGFMLGTTVPEQLRTFGGKLFRLEQHLDRLLNGLRIVGVDCPFSRSQMATFAHDLVAHNHPLLPPGDDLGLTIFITPGPYAEEPGRGPLVCLHSRPLAHRSFAPLYTKGQDLVTTDIRQVPSECWPTELKCRSRMHYWLADRDARQRSPGARALLQDLAGDVVEASTANVLIYKRELGLLSPPKESILPGISVATLAELAEQLNIPFLHQRLSVADVAAADEVLLCSTSPCVWPVLRLNGQSIGTGQPGPAFHQLIAAWSQHVGIDIVGQAQG